MHLMHWGDTYYPEPEGRPVVLEHDGCGGHPDDHLICDACGAPLESANTLAVTDQRVRDAARARRL
jgi:hypothetical protein